MARQESDREDLMGEATALARRVELSEMGNPELVVAGERADGRLSIYFGPDPVYHFDDQNRLRRAFVDGDLFRTQGNTLARLTRVRTPDATELRRHDLNEKELREFIERMRDRLAQLRDALIADQTETLRQVPEGDDLLSGLEERINGVLQASKVLAPPIKGKRV